MADAVVVVVIVVVVVDGRMPEAGGALIALRTGYVWLAAALAGLWIARPANGAERIAPAFCEGGRTENGEG